MGNCSKPTSWGLRWFISLLWGDILSENLKCQWSILENAAIFQRLKSYLVAACRGEFGDRGLLQGPFSPIISLLKQGPESFVDPLRSISASWTLISTVTRGSKDRASRECVWNLRYLGCEVSGSSLSPEVPSQSCIILSESGIWRVTKDAHYTDVMFYIPSSAFRNNILIGRHILSESQCL